MRKIKIRTAKSLEKKLEKKPRNEREQWQYYYLRGIYDSRIFGLCIYREKASCDFKNLLIYNVSNRRGLLIDFQEWRYNTILQEGIEGFSFAELADMYNKNN